MSQNNFSDEERKNMSMCLGTHSDFVHFIEAARDLEINEYLLWTVPLEIEILDAEEKARKKFSDEEFVVSSSFSKGTVKVEKIN
ncbi:hypothetical protein KKC62_02160 [Patescibacteria group bacterium]|nr:hypothetical protein [Patescibacteria group bacterium]MBU1952983.1 hypothetical protein [Patescibacteria group bacterium]